MSELFGKRWHSRQRRPSSPHTETDRKAAFLGLQDRLTRRYGGVIGPWLARRVAVMFRQINDPCVDNFRVCDTGDPDALAAYEIARRSGCCGTCDKSITHYASGRTFRYGCNFGH